MENKQHFRSKQTKQKIKNAFFQLLVEKPFPKITINHIVTKAKVGRSTFYSHYVDKYELLEKIVQDYTENFSLLFSKRFESFGIEHFEVLISQAIVELEKEREIILLLLEIQIVTANLYQSYRRVLEKTLVAFIKNNPSVVPKNLPLEYVVELYSSVSMTTITRQLKYGKNEAIISFTKKLQSFLLHELNNE